MRFGAHYLPTYVPELDGTVPEFYRRLFEQMELLDTLGFQDVWVTEHHFHEYGGVIPHPPTFLAAVARCTSRIHLGVAISILPLHHPLEVAEAYAMVDIISNGRLELGVGRGSTPPDYEGFGISFKDGALRMREATEIIRRAWAEDALKFHGKAFDFADVRVLPRPVQQPHPPIWVGASRSDDTFRWAGRKGFHLMTLPYMYDPPVLRRCIEAYHEALAAAGHDPGPREVLGKFHIYVAESNGAAQREAEPYLARYEAVSRAGIHRGRSGGPPAPSIAMRKRHDFAKEIESGNIIAGDPDRCIEIIRSWQETLGLTTISGTFHFGGMPQEQALQNIRRFAECVMPAFRDEARG